MNKKAIIEGFKEVARLVLLGAISIVITYLLKTVTDLPQTETTAIVLLILRGVDKTIHKSDTGVFKDVKGISPI